MLPTSGVSSAFGLIIIHLQAAHRLGSKEDLGTGTATITSEDIPTEPKPVTVASFSQRGLLLQPLFLQQKMNPQ